MNRFYRYCYCNTSEHYCQCLFTKNDCLVGTHAWDCCGLSHDTRSRDRKFNEIFEANKIFPIFAQKSLKKWTFVQKSGILFEFYSNFEVVAV